MANNFVKASFLLRVTDAEAEVLGRIDDAVAILANGDLKGAVLAEHYQALGDDFARIFPPTEVGLFESFRSIFSDPDYPRLGFTLQIDPQEGTGTRQVWLSGDQVDIETAALLLQSVAKSALPNRFRILPRLRSPAPRRIRRRLCRHQCERHRIRRVRATTRSRDCSPSSRGRRWLCARNP
ncbi:hypothetical protein [Sphingobium baderi]|uniref:hypothetical protein n=1 Tax=Sphingobium baderi TaxID=1332080 RepID=UPI002B4090C9|nr:hypothetical protein [Sphingobium baderi]WRD78731.1 hypothetical protein QQ987_20310 [Sphingobium baderi]